MVLSRIYKWMRFHKITIFILLFMNIINLDILQRNRWCIAKSRTLWQTLFSFGNQILIIISEFISWCISIYIWVSICLCSFRHVFILLLLKIVIMLIFFCSFIRAPIMFLCILFELTYKPVIWRNLK